MNTTTNTLAVERAGRGAMLLDEQLPGWASEIDLDYLDMSSGTLCVLGQLYGEYEIGVERVFAVPYYGGDYLDSTYEMSRDHGFTNADPDTEVDPDTRLPFYDFNDLQAAWEAEIMDRLPEVQ